MSTSEHPSETITRDPHELAQQMAGLPSNDAFRLWCRACDEADAECERRQALRDAAQDAAERRHLHEACREAEARRCLLYTSPSPRDRQKSRMPSSA